MVTFPHANGFAIDDEVFIALWDILSDGAGALPRLNSINPLNTYIPGRQATVEFISRVLVPIAYRNAMQATNPFMDANTHLLNRVHVVNPATGMQVNGAQLLRNGLQVTAAHIELAEGYLEALEEPEADPVQIGQRIQPPHSARIGSNLPATNWVQLFVDQVHGHTFQPKFRGRNVGTVVNGWPARLLTYFWPSPKPANNHIGAYATLKPLISQFLPLINALNAGGIWNPAQQRSAVNLAKDVFQWGNVPQDAATVTAAAVQRVILSAITKTFVPGSLMNSGWTKIAALASDHLENSPSSWPEVIWDSRVATSVVSRLDSIVVAAGLGVVPPALAGIGRVDVGRGGTRPRTYTLQWSNGYQSWPSQYAGSDFVRQIRDHLNSNLAHYGEMPNPIDDNSNGISSPSIPWTMRGVEMVLFMDGY